jgi:hypothetical protein
MKKRGTTLTTLGNCILAFASTNTKSLRVSARIGALLLALGILLDVAELEADTAGSTILSKVFGNFCGSINRVVLNSARVEYKIENV